MIAASPRESKGKTPGAWGTQKRGRLVALHSSVGAIADNVGFLSTLRGAQLLIAEPIHDKGASTLRFLRRRHHKHHRGRTSEQKRPQKVRRALQEGARQVERGGRPRTRTGLGPVART